jgi:GT2 family glycosyltransferase
MSHPGTRASLPGVCVINYNGSRYLPETLGRIRDLQAEVDEVVIVDDASTDDSLAVARKALPTARVIALEHNRGPGPARNTGLAALGADRVLFVDNDAVLEPGAIARLSKALDESPRAVMAVPRVVSASDPDHIEYEGGGSHFSGMVTLRSAGGSAQQATAGQPAAIGSLISCAFLLDRARWGPGELFDDEVQIYGEDHELGLRARILGHELLAVPTAVVRHGRGTPDISIRETGRFTALRIRNTILNRWQVLIKLYEGRTLVLLAPYLAAFEIFQLAGCIALGWGRHWRWAVASLVGHLPELRARRQAFQRVRRRGDRDTLEAGPHPFNPALRRRGPVRFLLPCLDAFGNFNWALARPFLRPDRSR